MHGPELHGLAVRPAENAFVRLPDWKGTSSWATWSSEMDRPWTSRRWMLFATSWPNISMWALWLSWTVLKETCSWNILSMEFFISSVNTVAAERSERHADGT